jgi:hypothetical protein
VPVRLATPTCSPGSLMPTCQMAFMLGMPLPACPPLRQGPGAGTDVGLQMVL